MSDQNWTYVLRSVKDGKFYIGHTNSLERRMSEHHSGRVKSTAHRRPLILIHQECFSDLTEAVKREKYLKTAAGRRWLNKHLAGRSGGTPG